MNLLSMLHAMDKNFIFSGQLFFRQQGPAIEMDLTTREIFSVSGVIAVPNNVKILGEHQYSLAGFHTSSQGIILGLDQNGHDMTKMAEGKTIGSLLLEPIWKI